MVLPREHGAWVMFFLPLKSHIFHGFLLIAPWVIGLPGVIASYLPGILKDLAASRKKPIKPIVIGMVKIMNGIVFSSLFLYVLL